MMQAPAARKGRIRPVSLFGFALVHLAALGVFFIGFSWKGVLLCVVSYYVRMFAITAGFHRYFSHRTYRLNRFWQFALAALAQTSAQRGVLWWASVHRHHHRYSDQPQDAHSPIQRGFWWSHIGWILSDEQLHTDESRVPDLARFPELRFLNKNEFLLTILYAALLAVAFGPVGLFYGYFLSTVLLWHGTFSINSVMHLFGRRAYATSDDSRNSFLFALVTMGEGWHNNHHYYPGAAAQGFRWWQFDASYYLLWLAERVGIVREMRRVPGRVRAATLALMSGGSAVAVSLHERLERLSATWNELQGSMRETARGAVEELDRARATAASRLESLQNEYAAARTRAGAAADRRMNELAAEIERTRLHLVLILEDLIRTASTGAVPA